METTKQTSNTSLFTAIILVGIILIIGLIIYNYYKANQGTQLDHFDCGCGNANIPPVVIQQTPQSIQQTPQSIQQVQPQPIQNEPMKNTEKSQIVLYYATWCGHCKKFAPEWEKVKNDVTNSDLNNVIMCVEYDCDLSRQICSNSKIQGFPSLILYKKDGTKVNYPDTQPRTHDLVMKFINQNMN